MPDTTDKPIVNDVSAPTIEKHSAMMASNDISKQQDPKPDVLVSSNGNTITPNASATQADSILTQGTDSAGDSTEPEQVASTDTAPSPSPSPSPESPYEASDSLPDMSQKKTTEMTNDMQSPRIYDTKEYVVPIHDTMHGHGTAGKIVAAVVSVVVVLAIVSILAYAII